MIASASAFLSDWVHYAVPTLSLGLGYLTAYYKLIRPARKAKQAKQAKDKQREQARDDLIDGVPARPGLSAAVPALGMRFENVEAGQAKLEQRMNESNGTQRHILDEVTGIKKDVATIAGHWQKIEPVLTKIMNGGS